MKTRFVIISVLVSLFMLSFTTAGWFHYKDALTGFEVDMPAKPIVNTGTHPISHAPLTTAKQKAPGHAEFIAIGCKNAAPIPIKDHDKVLDEEINIYCNTHHLPKPSYPPIKHHPSGYDYKIVKVNNGTLYANIKVCVNGANVHSLIVANNGSYAPAADVSRFFDSFEK